MSAFSKVYEQWLTESSSGTKISAPSKNNNRQNESNYKDPEGLSDLMDSDSSTSDESTGGSSDEESSDDCDWTGKFPKQPADSAPILIDDDDEVFHNDQRVFEEPPILEPVSKSSHSSKHSGSRFSSPGCSDVSLSREGSPDAFKSYSRRKLTQSKSADSFIRNNNSYSSNNLVKHTFRNTSRYKKSKVKDRGNLFDKITRFSGGLGDGPDDPPPLIPGPEALRLQAESPSKLNDAQTNQKHPNSSPELRAMEADSTSELSGESSQSTCLVKDCAARDVTVECDSTCMLGGSPPVVSPASSPPVVSPAPSPPVISIVGQSEVRDQGGGTDAEAGSPAEQARGNLYSGELARQGSSEAMEGCTQPQRDAYCNSKISTLSSLGLCPGPLYPQPEPVPVLPHHILDEPPVLCAFPEASKEPLKINKKRHTIDSPCVQPPVCKRLASVSSCKDNEDAKGSDCSAPPLLPLAASPSSPSHSLSVHTLQKEDDFLKEPLKSKSMPTIPSKKIREQRRAKMKQHKKKRRVSLPVEHVPASLRHFVLASCQLSALQCSVHTMLQVLFPQLREDIKVLTPESDKFAQFLNDVIDSLQLPDGVLEEKASPLTLTIKCNRNSSIYSANCQNPHTQASYSDLTSSPLIPHCSIISPPPLDDAPLVSGRRHTRNSLMKDPLATEVIPQMSNLGLSSKRLVIQLQQTSFHHVQDFCVLCCELLQLLLPELPLSLCNELADNPMDLLTLVQNMLKANPLRR